MVMYRSAFHFWGALTDAHDRITSRERWTPTIDATKEADVQDGTSLYRAARVTTKLDTRETESLSFPCAARMLCSIDLERSRREQSMLALLVHIGVRH